MPRYLISFDDGTMAVPEEHVADVARAAHSVVDELKAAGSWVVSGGMADQPASVVATDGTVTERPHPATKAVVGGFTIIDVPSRDEALQWAGKIASACRCPQEVREIMHDPDL